MADSIETLSASAAITSSPEKMFNFFKYDMGATVKIFPAAFKGAQLLQGEEGKVGCIMQYTYELGGISMSAKLVTEAIDDDAKSVTFSAIEGDVLKLYNSFKSSHTFTDGLAKCTISFERAAPNTLTPQHHVPFVVALYTLVDAHLLIN